MVQCGLFVATVKVGDMQLVCIPKIWKRFSNQIGTHVATQNSCTESCKN